MRADFAAALDRRRDDRRARPRAISQRLRNRTGTGYCAALLAQLASTIVSLERFQTLAVEASARIKAFGLPNVAALWGDGFDYQAPASASTGLLSMASSSRRPRRFAS